MVGLVFAAVEQPDALRQCRESFAPLGTRVRRSAETSSRRKSEQIEVGAKKLFLNGKARAAFAVYQLERDNIGIPDDNGITQQVGDQRSRGFEIDLCRRAMPGLRFSSPTPTPTPS